MLLEFFGYNNFLRTSQNYEFLPWFHVRGELRDMPGLGYSQCGEVAYTIDALARKMREEELQLDSHGLSRKGRDDQKLTFLNCKPFGFPYLVGIIKFILFFPWLLEK